MERDPGPRDQRLIQVLDSLADTQLALDRERVRREEVESLFDAMLRSMSDALLLVDARGLVLRANQAAGRMLHRAADELVGRPLETLVPEGIPASPWQLLEHLRRTQFDVLDFCRNPAYREPKPEEYWPPSAAPPSAAAWDESVEAFRRDRAALQQLAADARIDLFERIPHGSGQTYLREILVIADHNSYHVGQLIVVRRLLGAWRD